MAGYPTQKLLLVVVLLNVFLSIGQTVYLIQSENSAFDSTIGNLEDIGESYRTEESYVFSENLQEEGSFGRAISMGKTLFNVFIMGLNPFGINPSDYEDGLERGVIYGLNSIRTLLYLLLAIEAYLVLKNRKAT